MLNGGFYGYGPWMGHGWHWLWLGHGIVSTLVALLVIGFLVRLIYRGPSRFSGSFHRRYGHSYPSPGLAILDERYAKGEIGRDEYLQKRQDLMS